MGTLPETNDYIAGADCSHCNSGIFSGITPLYVEVNFDGVSNCPGHPLSFSNGAYLLTQTGAPCVWGWIQGIYFIDFRLQAGDSRLRAGSAGVLWFEHLVLTPCVSSFINQRICGVGLTFGEGGTGEVFWGPTIAPGP